MNFIRIFALLLLAAACQLMTGCTNVTEIYIYDDSGFERKVARVVQDSDGVADYDDKANNRIIVDTRYNAKAGSESIAEYLKNQSNKK